MIGLDITTNENYVQGDMEVWGITALQVYDYSLSYNTLIDEKWTANEQRRAKWTNPRRVWTLEFKKTPEGGRKFEEFFKLFMQTSERDGVQFHQKNYYLGLLNSSAETQNAPVVRLYIAKHEADVLAGIITLFCKKEAVYLYGASGNIKRNFMPAYLLQWNAICDAKKIGCPVYDFYGCPPEENKNHPMHGLFLFKTGFGGKLIHRPGSFDVVLKKNWYAFYKTAEKLRAWFYKYLKKKIAGR